MNSSTVKAGMAEVVRTLFLLRRVAPPSDSAKTRFWSMKHENLFVRVNVVRLLPHYAPKTVQKWVRLGMSQPNYQRRKIAMYRSHHYGIFRENSIRHRDFIVGPKLENNKSKMANGRHLRNTHACVSRPVFNRFAPNLVWCFVLTR